MITEEHYKFTDKAKKGLAVAAIIGVIMVILGILMVGSGGGGAHGGEHGQQLMPLQNHALASNEMSIASVSNEDVGEHEEGALWLNRLYTNLWINNIFFVGMAIIGVFFVAVQYAAQAGWSAGVRRIPEAFGYWLPIGAIITLVLFFVAGHHIFHWTHTDLYVEGDSFDPIISGKQAYFFWPLTGESGIPIFFLLRMVLYFGIWYWFFTMIRKHSLKEDIDSDTQHWYKMRSLSAIFLVIFSVTSSTAAWDWVMSIDTHWFSTMFGWYNFASWWVAGLALITLIVISLKEKGYLSIVNNNHLHDLGKFIWAFTIFWTYIWFSQFLLIYYANIPEEAIYFVERLTTGQYAPVFYINLILNFFLPFLLLMTRDAKRQARYLKIVCFIILIGHWFDFYLMITPGTMKFDGGFGFMEIGVTLIFAAAFLYVVFSKLSKASLVAINDPMLNESVHHHI